MKWLAIQIKRKPMISNNLYFDLQCKRTEFAHHVMEDHVLGTLDVEADYIWSLIFFFLLQSNKSIFRDNKTICYIICVGVWVWTNVGLLFSCQSFFMCITCLWNATFIYSPWNPKRFSRLYIRIHTHNTIVFTIHSHTSINKSKILY